MIGVLWTLAATSFACGILGPFLVSRRLSMIADALSHSVLLGIVLAYAVVRQLDSPWLMIGAALFGILTVAAIEVLSESGLIRHEDALGIVFPVFFSLAVIIITRYFRNTHLDIDMVLMGNPLFAPFIKLFGFPKAMVQMLVMFVVNAVFIAIHYEDLKVSTFDPEFAQLQGLKTKRLYYELMFLTSMTAVLAFDSVGAILVVSMFVTPAACAILVTKRLSVTILVTLVFGFANALAGYTAGMRWNVSVSGLCSVSGLLALILVSLFRRQGILRAFLQRLTGKEQMKRDLLLIHLYHHRDDHVEQGFDTLHAHLNWPAEETKKRVDRLTRKNLIIKDREKRFYYLSEEGKQRVRFLLDQQ